MSPTRSLRKVILPLIGLALASPALAAPADKKAETSAKKPAAKKPAAKGPAAKKAAAPAKPAKPGKGDVTRAQVIAQTKQIFALADANKDGFIDQPEFRVRMTAVLNRNPPGTPGAPSKEQAQRMLDAAAASFKTLDTDGNGKLSLSEASKRPMEAFDMADVDHDGVVTMAEKMAAVRGAGLVESGPQPKLEPGR